MMRAPTPPDHALVAAAHDRGRSIATLTYGEPTALQDARYLLMTAALRFSPYDLDFHPSRSEIADRAAQYEALATAFARLSYAVLADAEKSIHAAADLDTNGLILDATAGLCGMLTTAAEGRA